MPATGEGGYRMSDVSRMGRAQGAYSHLCCLKQPSMSKALHVAHAVLSLDIGGLERIVVNLVREGRRLGQQVSVICLERSGTLACQAETLGARVLCIDKKPGLQLKTGASIKKVLRDLRPDV